MVCAGIRAIPIAGLSRFEYTVSTDGRAVVIQKGIASVRAAAVVTFADFDGCVVAFNITIFKFAGETVDGAGIIIIAVFGTISVAQFARVKHAVSTILALTNSAAAVGLLAASGTANRGADTPAVFTSFIFRASSANFATKLATFKASGFASDGTGVNTFRIFAGESGTAFTGTAASIRYIAPTTVSALRNAFCDRFFRWSLALS